MRVAVIRRPIQDERGAIAILSAILAVVLIAISAFAVDFGMAYRSKRQLQTAADAAALAAGAYYAQQYGDCTTLTTGSTGSTNKTAAQGIVNGYLAKNRPGANLVNFDAACDLKGRPVMKVTVNGSTDVVLGEVTGSGSSITTQRSAQATVEVPKETKGLRPYMLCSQFIPDPALMPTGFIHVDFPTSADTTGNCPHTSGNWFTLDCPHVGNASNGNPDLAAATSDGCSKDHPLSIVDPQVDTTPTTLRNSLLAACPATANFADYDPDCLSANPGTISANNVITAWDSLISLHKPIVFPVFCGKPTCDPAAFSIDGGNNTLYPIYKFATAQVCGYHWGNKDSGAYVSTGLSDLCNGADAHPGTNSDNYLLLAFTHLQVSGLLEESDCAVGDPTCDGGQRSVLLTK